MINKNEMMSFLRRNKDNRGVMASLRCLLKTEQRFRGWQLIAPFGGIGEVAAETVSGLYAMHPMEQDDASYNLGDACRKLAEKRKKGGERDTSPFDRRFRRLLSCDTKEELCLHLVDVVRGLKNAEIPVNFETLYNDIIWWGNKVREKWAIHYWSERKEDNEYVPD